MGTIVSAIVDGVLKAAFGYLTQIMEKRGLIQQGREAQHAADLEESVAQGREAAKTTESVSKMEDAALDKGLEAVRNGNLENH